MHWACYKGHAEVVYKLCELGANKEVRTIENLGVKPGSLTIC